MTKVLCGTESGYTMHMKTGTTACYPCLDAHRDYNADWRVRTGRTKNATVPYWVLGMLLTWVPDHVLTDAEEELGKALVQRAIDARHRARAS